ncbi:T9SS type A sorting domain-containing protein [Salmonirosea aquatica]|uniref:T9SS type A sorting domain-containing protein n=1 Tax=Salmonirosea aquatica TaxID=2654236 RepID=A0A7C9FYV3_9BACT|nr:T9SS type A sorting domain-containing protein [Cytophagaceae bacterium SJW1-29]
MKKHYLIVVMLLALVAPWAGYGQPLPTLAKQLSSKNNRTSSTSRNMTTGTGIVPEGTQTDTKSYNDSGEYKYAVPGCGMLTLTARGADGATSINPGGSGATLTADFPVLAGDTLFLIVGHEGGGLWQGNSGGGSGGGGTGVVLIRGGVSTLLMVAAGGGGAGFSNDQNYGSGKGASANDGTPRGGTSSPQGGGGGGGFIIPGGGSKGGKAGRVSGGAEGGTGYNSTGNAFRGGFGFGGGGAASYGGNENGGGGGGGYGGGDAGANYAGGQGGTSFVQTVGVAPASNIDRKNGTDGRGNFIRGSVQLIYSSSNLPTACPDYTQSFKDSGNHKYAVPGCGILTLTARGADGATSINNGGSGATLRADFAVQKGDTLLLVVGHEGNGQYAADERGNRSGGGSGGGGTGVVLIRQGISSPLLVAAGGGGGGFASSEEFGRGKGASAADGTAQGGNSTGRSGGGGGGFNASGGGGTKGGEAGTLTGGGQGGTDYNNSSGYEYTFRGGFGFGAGGAGKYDYSRSNKGGGGGGGGYGGGSGGQNSDGGSGGISFVQTTGPVPANNIMRQDGLDGVGDFIRGSVQLSLKLSEVQPPELATASGDPRVPAGQQSATVCQNSGNVTFLASGCDGGTINWTGDNNSNGTGNIVASSANMGTVVYSATCTAGGLTSCPVSVSVTTVASPVTLTPTVTPVSCQGGSNGKVSLLVGNGTAPFTYSNDGGTNYGSPTHDNPFAFTGLSAGTYQFRVKDAKGCASPVQSATVTEPTVVTVSISGNTSVVYGYGSNCTTLTASATGGTGPKTFQWTAGTSSTNTTVNVCPTTTTTYTVLATDQNGCTGEKSVTVMVLDVRCGYGGVKMCLGGRELCLAQYLVPTYLRFGATLGDCNTSVPSRIGYEEQPSEPVLSLSLKAYPNPTTSALTVEVSGPVAGAAQLDVLDVAGRPVQQRVEKLSEGMNRVEFNLGGQAQGTYLLRCRDALGRQAVVRVQKH